MTDPTGPEPNLAVFCDFENVAIGVRDARYETFDIQLVLERLLDKGKIVVKKAYADWDRYRSSKRPMHEAAFELIEIPHISYSGKNSADIRMVVDALDLCYTKSHVDVFVIVSGDSDFSPLVSKLRENDKTVIGVGVKNSSSDLLIDNCDEFIFYDDLVRELRAHRRAHKAKVEAKKAKQQASEKAAEKPEDKPGATKGGDKPDAPKAGEKTPAHKLGEKSEAHELVLDTLESLFKDREGSLHGSMVKQVLRRKHPRFEEGYYGYRTFTELLEHMRDAELLEIARDEKSGGYLVVGFGPRA